MPKKPDIGTAGMPHTDEEFGSPDTAPLEGTYRYVTDTSSASVAGSLFPPPESYSDGRPRPFQFTLQVSDLIPARMETEKPATAQAGIQTGDRAGEGAEQTGEENDAKAPR